MPAVEQVIFTALAKDPRERYTTAGDFATALARASLGSTSSSTVDEDTSPLPAVVEPRSVSTNESGKAEATGMASMHNNDPSASSLHPGYQVSPLTPPPPPGAATSVPPLPAGAAMDQSVPPVWAQSTQQQPRRQFPLVAVISVLLVVLLAVGGIVAAFSRSSGTDKTTNISVTSAGSGGIVQTTGTSNTTKNTQGYHNATVTAQAQATSSVTATATATRTSAPTPTPVPKTSSTASTGPDQLYNTVTSASPTWSDPLTSRDNNNWTISSYCSFSGGSYHVTATTAKTVEACFASNTYFCNMAIQVQITNFSGEGGGIKFRAASNGNAYSFIIKPEGAYQFGSPSAGIIPYTRTSLSAVHTGYNVSNVVTIIARGSNFYFYVNQQYLTSASDSSQACGKIGLYALDWTGSASVSFSNAKVWKL
jgi:hypothetical protein